MTMRKRSRIFNFWNLITLLLLVLYVVFFLSPVFRLLKESVVDPVTKTFTWNHFIKFFSKSYYVQTIINSFKVTIAATTLTLIIGVPLAYLTNIYKVKGKKFINIVIIMSSMSAPFIGAYSWILLLGRNGLITRFFLNVLKIKIPDIYGFNGILLVLTLQLFPLVYLYIQGALSNVDNTLFEASESMGVKGISRFFKVVLPLIRPTVFASGLLVFMRAFADFGTPMLIGEGYFTFPRLIFDSFVGEVNNDAGFAASISVIAIIVTTTFFLGQRYLANKKQFSMSALHPIQPKKMKPLQSVLVHLFIYCFIALAFMPQLYVFYTSFLKTSGLIFVKGYSLDSYRGAFSRMGSSIQNTFLIPGIAIVITIIIAVLIAYITIRRRNIFTTSIDAISMVPYIIPGSVMGIALVSKFSSGKIILTGTMIIMVIAMIIRRLPYTIRSSAATLSQISISTEEAAISLGASEFKTFVKVTVPMMASGIISGAILSWITMITELSTSILLYTGKTQTMTIAIYTQVIRGNYGIAAALATILSLLTLVSLLVFMKLSKGKELTL